MENQIQLTPRFSQVVNYARQVDAKTIELANNLGVTGVESTQYIADSSLTTTDFRALGIQKETFTYDDRGFVLIKRLESRRGKPRADQNGSYGASTKTIVPKYFEPISLHLVTCDD